MLAPEQHEKNDDRNWDADQPKQRAFTESHVSLLTEHYKQQIPPAIVPLAA